MDALRDPLILLNLIEGENAALLAASRRRRTALRTAWEATMTATENLGDVITRVEADEAAREQADTDRHARIQELRQMIADLQAEAALTAAGAARLSAVAAAIEASTTAEQADTTEPAAPPV